MTLFFSTASSRSPAWLGALAVLLVMAAGAAGSGAAAEDRPGVARPAETIEAVPADSEEERVAEEVRLFDKLLVVGSADAAGRVPGSAHVLELSDLERQDHSDIHRVLRQVPGINIQEEDGYGLRPNIGIRGTGVERSQKVTLLEDGVLIAPAPYSAPSAYYAPTAGRMEGFEIRKGSGAIRQGPYTNGGAINYLSKSIPGSPGGGLRLAVGEEDLRRARLWLGGSGERLGWLLETYQLETAGFKRLDGGGETGFDLGDYVGKLRVTSRPGAPIFQALELKLGKTEQSGDETYLGLSQRDFELDPYRRYPSSAGDHIVTDHEQVQLRYFLQPSSRLSLTATAYRNDFYRNWFKLEKVRGTGVATVLEEPERFADLFAILRGETDSAPGALQVRHNRRTYYSEGVQLVLGAELGGGPRKHQLRLGLRHHRDQEDRFQEDDRFQMSGGRRVFTSAGVPGSQANRIADAEATALFVEDTFAVGRWTWSPGVRVESIDLRRGDFGPSDPERAGKALERRSNHLVEVLPGLGVSYSTGQASRLFLGIHRGFSPPSPGSTRKVNAEESLNYELGWRFDRRARTAEAIFFYSDYDNLLGNDTVSGGGVGSGDQFNGGEVRVRGLEAGLGFDLARSKGARFSAPVRLAYTYTVAEFQDTFETEFADWAPSVKQGDRLPYLPEHQLFGGLSLEAPRWSLHLDAAYTDAMRTRAGRGPIAADRLIDSRLLLDVRTEYEVRDRLRVWAQLLNATDEIYVAARRPAGVRPGRPRALLLGCSFDFEVAGE